MMKTINFFIFIVISINTYQNCLAQTAEIGMASFYSDNFEGKITASGKVFSQSKLTAAHRSIPFNTKIRVTNLSNDKSVIVIVNDRGPYAKGRIVDLSKKAAIKLDFIDKGVTKVKLEILEDK